MEQEDYEFDAKRFLHLTKTAFAYKFTGRKKYWDDDKEKRDVWEIILSKGDRKFTFTFGQSIVKSAKKIYSNGVWREPWCAGKTPTAYDVLACLTKYPVDSFNDFCDNYGYDDDSIKAENIYKAVLNEYTNLERLYSDKEMELLRELT